PGSSCTMRGRIIRVTLVLALLVGASIAFAYSTGPPASRTGAPTLGDLPQEGLCNACHSGNPVNGAGSSLQILDVPSEYSLGQTYVLRVRLSYAWGRTPPPDNLWGFEITAVAHASGFGAGTFDVTTDPGPMTGMLQLKSGTSVFPSRRYVEHT